MMILRQEGMQCSGHTHIYMLHMSNMSYTSTCWSFDYVHTLLFVTYGGSHMPEVVLCVYTDIIIPRCSVWDSVKQWVSMHTNITHSTCKAEHNISQLHTKQQRTHTTAYWICWATQHARPNEWVWNACMCTTKSRVLCMIERWRLRLCIMHSQRG